MLEMSSPGGSLLGLLLAIREAILRFRFVDELSLDSYFVPRPRQRVTIPMAVASSSSVGRPPLVSQSR